MRNGSTTFDGLLRNGSGTLALAKIGTGTLTLTASNTYSGGTTISGGTLQIGNGGNVGSLATGSTILDNATLAFSRSGTITQGTNFSTAAISGSGSLLQLGPGKRTAVDVCALFWHFLDGLWIFLMILLTVWG